MWDLQTITVSDCLLSKQRVGLECVYVEEEGFLGDQVLPLFFFN